MTATREARGGVLVAGGGFAGGYVARLLGRQGATIVSPENFMLYTPLLPEAASGTLEPRHVVVPLRQMCPHAELLLGRVTAIDAEQRTAQVETPEAGSFEVGVRPPRARARRGRADAAGPRPRRARGRVQGPRRRDQPPQPRPARARGAPTPSSIPTRRDAHLTFVFVGAGYAGVEALAELSDLVARRAALLPAPPRGADSAGCSSTRRRRSCPRSRPRLGDYAARELARRGVEIHVSTTLESLDRRAKPCSRTATGSRRTRSSGRPA